MGRYINKYLRYHLQEAGSLERVGTLLPQLISFLNMESFTTLDDRSRKFWTVLHSPPSHVDPGIAWVYKACAFGFHELVDLVIDNSTSIRDEQRTRAGIVRDGNNDLVLNDLPVTFRVASLRNALTPATCTCLAIHAILNRSYRVLRLLLEKNMCVLSSTSSLSPVCDCCVSDPCKTYTLVDFHGL